LRTERVVVSNSSGASGSVMAAIMPPTGSPGQV
jgi:hypothetical protein